MSGRLVGVLLVVVLAAGSMGAAFAALNSVVGEANLHNILFAAFGAFISYAFARGTIGYWKHIAAGWNGIVVRENASTFEAPMIDTPTGEAPPRGTVPRRMSVSMRDIAAVRDISYIMAPGTIAFEGEETGHALQLIGSFGIYTLDLGNENLKNEILGYLLSRRESGQMIELI